MNQPKNQTRENEHEQVPERLPRTYNVGDRWYFELRGGGQKGPYDSEEEMEQALQEFIRLQQQVKAQQ